MNQLIGNFQVSPFFRSVVAIAGGTAAAQVVGLLVSPLLTRLYTPEAMGLWGLFVSFVGVASVLGTLRYEVAIVAAKNEHEALLLTKSTLYIAVFVAAASGGVFEFFRRQGILGYSAFPSWVVLMVITASVVTVWGTVLRYWAIRQGKFAAIGRFTVTQALFRALSQLVSAVAGDLGLLTGELVGRFAGLRVLWKLLPVTQGTWLSKSVLVKYRSYPLVQLPSSFLDTLALMAPVPVFTSVYGVAVGGGLALAQRVVGLPLNLIGASVADVFYGKAAKLARDNPVALGRFLLSTVLRLGLISLALGVALWFVAPRVVVVVFGSAWEQAGLMMRAMAPWLVAMLAISPVSRVVFLSKYAWLKLIYDLLSIAVVSSPLFLSIEDPIVALTVVSWAKAGQLILYLLLLFFLVDPTRFYANNRGG